MTRGVALAGLVAFTLVAVVEHGLEPQLDPARHTISEYVNTGTGALMIAAFVAWSASLFAVAALMCHRRLGSPTPRIDMCLAALLTIAAIGLLLTACFATQTSAGVLPPGIRRSTGGRIHDLASGAAMVALLLAVIVSIAAFRRQPRFRALAVVALTAAIVASAALLCVGDSVDGVRQRALVADACLWQLGLILTVTPRIARRLRRVSGT